jgi:hypothetical protein
LWCQLSTGRRRACARRPRRRTRREVRRTQPYSSVLTLAGTHPLSRAAAGSAGGQKGQRRSLSRLPPAHTWRPPPLREAPCTFGTSRHAETAAARRSAAPPSAASSAATRAAAARAGPTNQTHHRSRRRSRPCDTVCSGTRLEAAPRRSPSKALQCIHMDARRGRHEIVVHEP